MTRVLRTRSELREALARAPRPVGLVPTMGWLHDGHRALVRRARAADATTVVTIFVNPRQFGDPADLSRYPRDEARDVAMCADEGVDLPGGDFEGDTAECLRGAEAFPDIPHPQARRHDGQPFRGPAGRRQNT